MVGLGVGSHHGPISLRGLFLGFLPGSRGSQRELLGVRRGSRVLRGNGSFLTIRYDDRGNGEDVN